MAKKKNTGIKYKINLTINIELEKKMCVVSLRKKATNIIRIKGNIKFPLILREI